MKTFFKWTLIIGGLTAAGIYTTRAVQQGRQSLKRGLADAEAVAENTQKTVGKVQQTLHDARSAI